MIAGVGAGKTFSLCLEAVKASLEEKTSGTIVASSYRNLSDYVLPMITDELWVRLGLPNGWDEFFPEFQKQTLVATCINGSTIRFRSCDRPDDLKGPNLGWFALDEAARVPHSVWRYMVARLRLSPERGWISTTPRGRNWVWEEFAKEKRKNYEYFRGSTLENPHVSDTYKKSLLESYAGSFLEQEVMGEFVRWEGLVYPQVDLEVHHLDAPEHYIDAYRYGLAGVDWGWAEPTVVLVGLVGNDGFLHLVDEYYQTKKPIEDVAEAAGELAERWQVRTFYCDPSRPEFIRDFRSAGLDARKGKNPIDPGIAAVTKQIDSGFAMDFTACPETADEFALYHYEEDDSGRVLRDRPVDRDNHCMDALRYMVYGHTRSGYAISKRGFR